MSDLKRFLSQYHIITANGGGNSSEIKRVSSEEFLSSSLVGSDVIVLTRKDLYKGDEYTLQGLQLKALFESFIQFLNPTNDPIHRSILSLLYFPI